jgi:hypothetical protein
MRTTLDIADDVLAAAKTTEQGKTVGVVFDGTRESRFLLDRGLLTTRNGVPLLKVRRRNAVVTLKMVNNRDETP